MPPRQRPRSPRPTGRRPTACSSSTSYEQALWVVPSAAILSSPILVNPDQATLAALGAKTAVVVGDAKPAVSEMVNLADKEAVWKFQLSLMAELGKKCDYVVMTNPHDCDEKLNPNVQWPYLSLAAAPLAAYRQALVQTGDYTGDRKALHALGGALGDTGDKAKYALGQADLPEGQGRFLRGREISRRQRPHAQVPRHGRRGD